MSKIQEVSVTNKNSTEYADGWHGHKFAFPVNKTVNIPLEAAVHIFGFGLKDNTPALRRMGVANHPDGKRFLSNFKIDVIEYVKKEDADEATTLRAEVDSKDKEIAELKEAVKSLLAENEQLKAASSKGKKQKGDD